MFTKRKSACLKLGDYIIDADVSGGLVNCWMWHREYGVKMHMFGIQFTSFSSLERIIEKVIDGYVETYNELYMQD